MSKDVEIEVMETEGKQFKKLGKSRSKGKVEYPLDCGADAEADQNGQGISSLREEKVSSLRTVSLIFHTKLFYTILNLWTVRGSISKEVMRNLNRG